MVQQVVDDWSLLRAINRMEGKGEENSEILNGYIIDQPDFDPIRENEHLRGLLRTLLETNIAVRHKRREAPNRSSLGRLFRQQKLKEYQSALDALVLERDEAFKKYEMLRRLVAYDNVFLARPRA